MKRLRIGSFSFIVLISIFISCGCISNGPDKLRTDDNEEINPEDNTDVKKEILKVELFVNQTVYVDKLPGFDPNDQIHVPLSLKISWDGDNNWTGHVPSPPEYDFAVYHSNETVWASSHGKVYGQIVIGFSINKTNPRYYNVTWSIKKGDIQNGIYTVKGLFVATWTTVEKDIDIRVIDW